MSSYEEMLEKIERFTKGKLSGEELASFEAQLAEDEELQNHVKVSSIVDQMVVGNETLKLKGTNE